MAYQKLQLETAAKAIPSDDVLKPVPTSPHFDVTASGVVGSVITCNSIIKATGTAGPTSGDSVGVNINNGIKLVDAAATFVTNGVEIGDRFTSPAAGTTDTRVKFIESETEIVLENLPNEQIAVSAGDGYRIFAKNNFVDTCKIGDTVVSNTAAESTYITAIGNETQITVNTIGAIGGADELTIFTEPDANLGCILFVGGAGNVKVLTASGQEVIYAGVIANSWMPIQIKKLFKTDTTATLMVVNW